MFHSDKRAQAPPLRAPPKTRGACFTRANGRKPRRFRASPKARGARFTRANGRKPRRFRASPKARRRLRAGEQGRSAALRSQIAVGLDRFPRHRRAVVCCIAKSFHKKQYTSFRILRSAHRRACVKLYIAPGHPLEGWPGALFPPRARSGGDWAREIPPGARAVHRACARRTIPSPAFAGFNHDRRLGR